MKSQFTDWPEFKSFLIQSGALNQFFNSTTEEAIQRRIDESIRKGNHRGVGDYSNDPLQVEFLLGRVSELVDRILSYRREMRELEILAVKAAADYQLYLEQSIEEKALEISSLRRPVKQRAREDQNVAAVEFGDGAAMNRGMRSLAVGEAQQLKLELEAIALDESAIQKKWAAMDSYQYAYHLRHLEDGNAHHYAQRAEKLLALLAEDIEDAYERAQAASLGILMVHGRTSAPLPEKHNLDDFLLWCRKEIRNFNRALEHEIQYDLVVPLVQPILPGGVSVVTATRFNEALASASTNGRFVLSFEMPQELFFGDSNVRLTGVGVSYGNKTNWSDFTGADRNLPKDSFAQIRGSVSLPIQVAPTGELLRKPLLHFGTISVFTGQAPASINTGPEVANANPVGKWTITLELPITYKDIKAYDLRKGVAEDNPIMDLKIHMKIRALPGAPRQDVK